MILLYSVCDIHQIQPILLNKIHIQRVGCVEIRAFSIIPQSKALCTLLVSCGKGFIELAAGKKILIPSSTK